MSIKDVWSINYREWKGHYRRSDLPQSPPQPLLCFWPNLLDSDHGAVFIGAAQHDARTSSADKLAGSKVLGQQEAVLKARENA